MTTILPIPIPKWRFVEERKGFALKNLRESYSDHYHAESVEDLKAAFEEASKHDVIVERKYVSIYDEVGPWSRDQDNF